MLKDRYSLAFKLYPYSHSPDQNAKKPARHKAVVVGGGPIGLAMALDLGRQGISVLVLDDHEGIGMGSRAICFSKRALEIADRYDCGKPMLDKGVVWNKGKVFYMDRKIYEFDLLPEKEHKFPAFINLQQPYFERFIFEQIVKEQEKGAPIEIRGKNSVTNITTNDDHTLIDIMTPEGPYQLEADWLIACDGAYSPLRKMMGLGFEGHAFEDSFLIADIKMKSDDFPTERWFWFEPWFKSGASTLLHKQPDDVWRIDFQIGWDVDRDEELKEENIRARLDAMLGDDVEYEIVWSSIYTFQCRRMHNFRHNRVFFAGDSAHQVSPFGARGANSGMQDVDNLGWKLGMVIRGEAPDALLNTYDEERVFGADENIINSTRSTDFISPKSNISHIFRNAVLQLAEHNEFARPIVNSGRLSVPCTYDGLSLNSDDKLVGGPKRARIGSVCPDVKLNDGYLLDQLGGEFTLLTIDVDAPQTIKNDGVVVKRLALSKSMDIKGLLSERYLGSAKKAVYLIRPDQHVAARWNDYDEAQIIAALNTACAKG